MQYVPPLNGDQANPLRPYINANPAAGQQGSIPPAEAWEHPIREIVNAIEQAGLNASGGDLTQLWQAIQAAISNTTLFVKKSSLRQYLQFHAAVLNPGGVGLLGITAGVGLIVIDAGQTIVWRGHEGILTDEFGASARTFNHAANKTYHLRWHAPGIGRAVPEATYPRGRFYLEDLADAGSYNPSALAHTNTAFDGTYDSVLLGKLTTNGTNVATWTPYTNAPRLYKEVTQVAAKVVGTVTHSFPQTFNWPRTPRFYIAMEAPAALSYDSDYHIDPASGGITRETATLYLWSWPHDPGGYDSRPSATVRYEA